MIQNDRTHHLLLAAAVAVASAIPARAGSYGGGGGGSAAAPAQNQQPAAPPPAAPSRQGGAAPSPASSFNAGAAPSPASSFNSGNGSQWTPASAPSAPGYDAGSMASSPPSDPATAAADDDPPPSEEKAAPMTAQDAGDNFKTVVESFIAKNSRAGAWEYKEKGKTSPLVLLAVDSGAVRKTGKETYAGDATLRDAGTKRARRLEFTVDFSGANWKVVRVRPGKASR